MEAGKGGREAEGKRGREAEGKRDREEERAVTAWF
jgi:hypothetical protein